MENINAIMKKARKLENKKTPNKKYPKTDKRWLNK